MRTPPSLLSVTILATMLSACGQGTGPSGSSSALTITGQTDSASFGGQPAAVQAIRSGAVVAETPVGTDGRFALLVPSGTGYRLDFASSGGATTLVFPRQAGSIEHRFDVLGGGTFGLGMVRRIGDPGARSFYFSTASMALTASDATPAADADGVECEDGIDAVTGAVCVDDDDEGMDGMCSAEDDGAEDDGAEDDGAEDDGVESADVDGDNVECEDGIDPVTGAECDGGPAANPTDGAADGAEDAEDTSPTDAAVADHNLPTALGCTGGGEEAEDGDDVECEDGIDPATGAECDGGPAANRDGGDEI